MVLKWVPAGKTAPMVRGRWKFKYLNLFSYLCFSQCWCFRRKVLRLLSLFLGLSALLTSCLKCRSGPLWTNWLRDTWQWSQLRSLNIHKLKWLATWCTYMWRTEFRFPSFLSFDSHGHGLGWALKSASVVGQDGTTAEANSLFIQKSSGLHCKYLSLAN